jgi:non-ribosomal peptide synthetase component F
MVGMFVNTLPLRSRITAHTTLAEMITSAQQSSADTNDNQDVPLQKIVGALPNLSRQKDTSIFQAIFAHYDMGFFRSRQRSVVAGLKTSLLSMEEGWETLQPAAMFDLQVFVREDRGAASICFEYNADVLECDTVSRMASHYLTLLNCATSPEASNDSVWYLELLSAHERSKLLVEWNKTYQDFDIVGKCAHHLISEQVGYAHQTTLHLCIR